MIGMTDPKSKSSSVITVMRLTATVAEARIHEIASDEDNIVWGTHALERMEERGIMDIDVK